MALRHLRDGYEPAAATLYNGGLLAWGDAEIIDDIGTDQCRVACRGRCWSTVTHFDKRGLSASRDPDLIRLTAESSRWLTRAACREDGRDTGSTRWLLVPGDGHSLGTRLRSLAWIIPVLELLRIFVVFCGATACIISEWGLFLVA